MNSPHSFENSKGPEQTFSVNTSIGSLVLGVLCCLITYPVGSLVSPSFQSTFTSAPEWTVYAILFLFGGLMILSGTGRVKTQFIPSKNTIIRQRYLLFILPIGTRKYSFGDVRYIDFHHPDSGKLQSSLFAMVTYIVLFGYFYLVFLLLSAGRGESKLHELYVFTQNRDRLLFYRGFDEKKGADIGMEIARMTHTRLS